MKKGGDAAPEIIVGRTLEGTRTSGSGTYAGQEGHSFLVSFEDASHFRIRGQNGSMENSGTYRYRKTNPLSAELVMESLTGAREGSNLLIVLKFASGNDGAFEAKTTKGEPGDQTGVFKLR